MSFDQLFMFAAIGFLVVMMVLNSRKRKKQQEELTSALKEGASVMLTSGIYGVIVAVAEDRFLIETAPGSTLNVAKGAVARIVDGPLISVPAKAVAAKPAAKSAKPATKTIAEKPAAKKPAAKKPVADKK
ncbi:MAG: preprotein translocase subunit YajC [Actinomycetales bacterium]|nr:preprotein translocase subunit YajC [Actinomycetales bacterium]